MLNKNEIIDNNIIEVALEDEMHVSFLNYSGEVIENRAIPSVYDGLKPVLRRILYAMEELGLTCDKPHRKSARIVGDCLGKWHPHGDSSVYEAMVRMSQWWSVRYPLVDLQGNGGSIDGDSPAAMRYTEARMAPIVEEFLKDLKKNTVNWKNNFDDTMKEPEILPTILPNYLLNGGSGIAVGVACDIPSHNLSELVNGIIAFINNPEIELTQLLKIIKGPDLPTGGIAEGKDFYEIYRTGEGKFKVRAKHHIEDLKGGKKLIVITEIPYQTKKSTILAKLGDLYVNKKLEGVTDVRDESNLEEGIRIVIEVKKDIDPNYVLKKIFKKTDLESTQSVSMRAIVKGKLKTLSLVDYFKEYLGFQKDVLIKKTNYSLTKHRHDLHIQEGFLICLEDIFAIVETIAKSRNPKTAKDNLIKKFGLDEIQAQAVLDLRLSKLTSLGKTETKNKIKELKDEIKRLELLISCDENIFDHIKSVLKDIDKRYGDKRRTKIVKNLNVIEAEKPVVEFNIVIKDRNIRTYQTKNFKSDGGIVLSTDNTKDLILITKNGDYFKYEAEKIPPKVPVDIIGAFVTDFNGDSRVIALITSQGQIKRSYLSDYNINRTQSSAIKLEKDDELIYCLVGEENTEQSIVTIGSLQNYNCVKLSDVDITGRNTKGIKVMKLEGNETVENVFIKQEVENIVLKLEDQEIRVSTTNIEDNENNKRFQLKNILPWGKKTKVILGYELEFKSENTSEEITVDSQTQLTF
ncbi:DNA gyrase/topoisomerase IV subunit A [Alkaliphilus sp. B6464]|uniref:DNA gyrase/topoisomerase IV subunit A n=1 Tax=Alkaliphilus sp. B6464 TaxID=2731219 RepID=UPI001BA4E680|nr:DNA topoisomerase (ATP-hydrolyzing) [Alkaliphilus sp. B6464]QUH22079.1 DNA topoisomerase 4 subunit A [Alkaliphilus sp. B6464]